MTVGFIRLRDLSDGQFLFGYADIFGYEISMTVGFYLVSPYRVGFAGLRDLNDGWIYSVTRS